MIFITFDQIIALIENDQIFTNFLCSTRTNNIVYNLPLDCLDLHGTKNANILMIWCVHGISKGLASNYSLIINCFNYFRSNWSCQRYRLNRVCIMWGA